MPDEDAWPLAAAWNDDRILVFSDEQAEVAAMTWAIRFEHEGDPERVLQGIELEDPRLRADASGRDLVLSAGSDPAAIADWDGGLGCVLP
jgi:hypothetical protein